jgi:putative ABC transport system ATP-binding protein
MGVIFQSFQLLPMLNLVDNIVLPIDLSGRYSGKASRQRAQELLRMVELEEHFYKLPSQISGGQQQRAAIARALANDPDLLIADEPTGNLDTRTAGDIFDLFSELVVQGKTLLMVTHDKELARRVPRVVEIIDGKITRDEYVGGAAWTGY